MKTLFNLESLKTNKSPTIKEQNSFRLKLKHLLAFDRIISLCIDEKNLYAAFKPTLFNLDLFKQNLLNNVFPLRLNPVQI